MKQARVSDNKKKIGRPSTGVGTLVGQRWRDDQLRQIDHWRRAQADKPGRSEAIRRLVELALAVKSPAKQTSRARATAMAGKQLDDLVDASASADQQATRKRSLLSGPEEFESVRIDRPAKKK